MLTRRLSPFTAVLLSTVLSFVGACDDGDDKDDNADDETGSSSDSNSPDTSSEGGAEVCEEACANLGACGVPVDECLGFCTDDACGACLANSESCGEDCADACIGGTGDGDGDMNPDAPEKECIVNKDCGISFECVSCNLNDAEGWCEQSSECNFDTDCGFGGKCGYNVETSAFRCLPAEYCG